MLIREVIAENMRPDGRLLIDRAQAVPDGLDLGRPASPYDDADPPRASDLVLVLATDPRAASQHWPTSLPLGARVIVAVSDGLAHLQVEATLDATSAAGIALVDAIPVWDLGRFALAMIGVRSDVPVAPRPWLAHEHAQAAADESTAMRRALGAHVLGRAVERNRHEARFADLHRAIRERDALTAQVEALAEQGTISRKMLRAIRRSRTWRIARVIHGLAHPVTSARKVAKRYRRR